VSAIELQQKIRGLSSLPVGWDSYDAKPIDAKCIELACQLVGPILVLRLGDVQAVPCPDGGVQLEIHAGGVDLELWISPADCEEAKEGNP